MNWDNVVRVAGRWLLPLFIWSIAFGILFANIVRIDLILYQQGYYSQYEAVDSYLGAGERGYTSSWAVFYVPAWLIIDILLFILAYRMTPHAGPRASKKEG